MEQLVLCCSDGDVVEIGEGGGGEEEKEQERGRRLRCEFANMSKRVGPWSRHAIGKKWPAFSR